MGALLFFGKFTKKMDRTRLRLATVMDCGMLAGVILEVRTADAHV
jgi:hypothetical protein